MFAGVAQCFENQSSTPHLPGFHGRRPQPSRPQASVWPMEGVGMVFLQPRIGVPVVKLLGPAHAADRLGHHIGGISGDRWRSHGFVEFISLAQTGGLDIVEVLAGRSLRYGPHFFQGTFLSRASSKRRCSAAINLYSLHCGLRFSLWTSARVQKPAGLQRCVRREMFLELTWNAETFLTSRR
jgi:hypothetical protein